ncbi:dynamin-2B-like [Magnolia sinica]|uniref:dynamin-2B-like n=1 Tax=Magnolia sinica TaxID=86752 RepID=UPI0026599A73|nr:dynamin-2B-like [Magnolia sinica]
MMMNLQQKVPMIRRKMDQIQEKVKVVFKITSKVPYKTVLKAHSALLLKAESMQEKVEWINKIVSVMQPSKGAPGKGMQSSESGPPVRQSLSHI